MYKNIQIQYRILIYQKSKYKNQSVFFASSYTKTVTLKREFSYPVEDEAAKGAPVEGTIKSTVKHLKARFCSHLSIVTQDL